VRRNTEQILNLIHKGQIVKKSKNFPSSVSKDALIKNAPEGQIRIFACTCGFLRVLLIPSGASEITLNVVFLTVFEVFAGYFRARVRFALTWGFRRVF